MNRNYRAFIELGQTLAEGKGLRWDIPLDDKGIAQDGVGWNLTACVADVPPPTYYLRDLGADSKALAILNMERASNGLEPLHSKPLSAGWQDIIKAAVAEQLLFKRNTTAHVYKHIVRPLRVIATCVGKEPWQLNLDDLHTAIQVGKAIQASGKLGDLVVAIVKVVFDAHHVCDAGQMYPTLDVTRLPVRRSKSKHTMSEDELRANLEERKRAERLPERRAFWELVRIVMTEKPRTFMDELRFAAIRAMVISGFRIGEAALLPVDWKRERVYVDSKGQPAGEIGGISTSLMLRHFAEKQQSEESDSRILRENTQPVPDMFRQLLTETLDRVAQLTQPLRDTLKLQCETGRLLPWYRENDVVPFIELYTRVTGNPIWLDIDCSSFLERYRKTFDPSVLQELHQYQNKNYGRESSKLDMAVYMFGNRLQKQMQNGETVVWFRNAGGAPIARDRRMSWGDTYLNVGELEEHIRATTPTKVSDMAPLSTENGAIQSWEFLFLQPKRSLVEERNEGICDITRCMAVSRPDPLFIGYALGDATRIPSLFERYGATDEDRVRSINSHSLRHLQNTELFRLGVADTIISKRFNRRSVAQSYEYDHRSLAEELDQIEIPHEVEIILGEKSGTVARMIKAGKANGPIVDAFRRIQSAEGDSAAFEYLRVEADGFHATPYGHCLNSFTVDPCPKHLECFANCRHLSATDLPENRQNLKRLEGKFKAAIETIKSRPTTSLGWKNQMDHAERRLAGVQKLLVTAPGERVFPDGVDLSTTKRSGVLDD
ncbi:hypothetical protein [Noviherbaspirillum sp. Root189]|uniref:hypothetical protein n=1 Tax=Noviherbaspirillum sp. Root189 TaxID=1736487 RepID=UPI00070A0613|nr:hypothetical protein [Noviherbaspirillum sp. Root189]KRB81048.1 hypothetical protein ASE07_24900 [Noviherbaspirillum sp. Root189]